MSNRSKQIGNSFEYEIRDILREETGDNRFERVPSSGAYFGGANKVRAETSREDLVEIMSGDLICPPDWRWVCECKNEENVPYHQLFLGDGSSKIDDFLEQVSQDGLTSNKEPLLFMKLRRKGWKLPIKVNLQLKEVKIKPPKSKSSTIGILVAELASYSHDLEQINHISYMSNNKLWNFYGLDNWLLQLNSRVYK